MKEYECSVVVVQYNPKWEKLKRTLDSITSQKECDYEIVVADDGSKDNCFEKITRYFSEREFNSYQLVGNEQNGGTVKNVISGLSVATGKYARVIAPGDMLYSDTTLSKIVHFMNEYHAKEMFGKMAFYLEDNGKLEVFSKAIPKRIEPYKLQNKKRMLKNMVGFGDNISGASYTWEREYYLECLNRISGKVVYLEDCVSAFALYEGHEIHYMDEYVTWYEYGMGISTSANEKWTLRLGRDWIAFYRELESRFPKDIKIRRARFYHQLGQNRTLPGKIIKNVLFFDRYMYHKTSAKTFNRQESGIDETNIKIR